MTGVSLPRIVNRPDASLTTKIECVKAVQVDGMSPREAAAKYGVGKASIYGWLKTMRIEDTVATDAPSVESNQDQPQDYSLLSMIFDKVDYEYNLWAFGEMVESFTEYPDDPQICCRILYEMRWPTGSVICANPKCLHVLSKDASEITPRWEWRCDKCHKTTSVMHGSVFDARCITPASAIVLAIAMLQIAPDARFRWLLCSYFKISEPTAREIIRAMQYGFLWKSWNADAIMYLVFEYFAAKPTGAEIPEDELYEGIVAISERPDRINAYLEPLLKRLALLNEIWRSRVKALLIDLGHTAEDLSTPCKRTTQRGTTENYSRGNYIELGA